MPIHYEVLEDHIALITMDRPEARNAMDADHYSQLARCWMRVKDDAAIRVAVITGVGDCYCSGADLKKLIPAITGDLDEAEAEKERASDGGIAVLRNFDLFKPIIAAVNGFCLASGMEMLLGTDIRLASTKATFGLPEVRW